MAEILVIDDEEILTELIADILMDEGHTVRMALDGQAGLDEIARKLPDLIILDMNMPVMDGYEVAKKLRADPVTASVPIIALTGLSSSADYDAAYKAGCNAFIAKPLEPGVLVKTVEDQLAK